MEEIQQFFTQWVSGIAHLIPLGYAFGAGMVSTVNPCGFAMLPAYLGLYLGSRDFSPLLSTGVSDSGGIPLAVAVPAQSARAPPQP